MSSPGSAEAGNVNKSLFSGASGVELGLRLLSFGPMLILVVMIAFVSFYVDGFLSPNNVGNIMAQIAVLCVVAMGQQLVILTRGIDLSVGSNLALATVLGALVFKAGGGSASVALTMIATGALVGLINGVVYVYGRLPHPFIITLATLSICRGLALTLAPGHTTVRGMPDGIKMLGSERFLGIPLSFYVVIAVALLFLIMMRAMILGRWIYAVGGDPAAALGMGIPVKGVLISTYVICGIATGIGAVLLAGRTGAGSPIYGNLLELDTIAAVIIGGASFLGGRGHIGHALIGAVMIGVIRNALNLENYDIYVQMIAIGAIIVVAVEADVLRNRLEARVRVLQAART